MKISIVKGFHSDESCVRRAKPFTGKNTAAKPRWTVDTTDESKSCSVQFISSFHETSHFMTRKTSWIRLKAEAEERNPDIHATPLELELWAKHIVRFNNFNFQRTKGKFVYDGKEHGFPSCVWVAQAFVCAVYIWYTVNTESARSWCSVSRAFSVSLSLSARAIISFNPSHRAARFGVKKYPELQLDWVCACIIIWQHSTYPYTQTSRGHFTRFYTVLHDSRYDSHVFTFHT